MDLGDEGAVVVVVVRSVEVGFGMEVRMHMHTDSVFVEGGDVEDF